MIIIKSHFAFSGINIPSTINCSINSYFKDDQLKIYQHPRMGDTLTYHQSDFNYYITYSQYLD